MTALLCCMISLQIGATLESSCANTDPACSSSESASILQAHTQAERQHLPRPKESILSTIDAAPPRDEPPHDLIHREPPPTLPESETPLTLDVIRPKIQKALKAFAEGKDNAGTTVKEDDDKHAVIILGPDATDSHTEEMEIIKNADPDKYGLNLVQANNSDGWIEFEMGCWHGVSHCADHDCKSAGWCWVKYAQDWWCYCKDHFEIRTFNMQHYPQIACPGPVVHPTCYWGCKHHTVCTSGATHKDS